MSALVPLPPGDDALHDLYREGRTDEGPPPALDAAILAAGRDAVRAAKPAVRRPRPWWQVWLAPVSVAAVAVVGLTLSLHVAEEPDFDARARLPKATPAAAPAAMPERSAVAETAAPKAEAARPPAKAPPRPQAERGLAREEAQQPAAPPPAMAAPAPVVETLGRSAERERRQEADRANEAASPKPARSMDQSPTTPPAAELKKDTAPVDTLRDAGQSNRLMAPASSAAKKSRQDAAGAGIEADPARWIESIRRLRADGREREAAAELLRFRGRYPDFPLPADLQP